MKELDQGGATGKEVVEAGVWPGSLYAEPELFCSAGLSARSACLLSLHGSSAPSFSG